MIEWDCRKVKAYAIYRIYYNINVSKLVYDTMEI